MMPPAGDGHLPVLSLQHASLHYDSESLVRWLSCCVQNVKHNYKIGSYITASLSFVTILPICRTLSRGQPDDAIHNAHAFLPMPVDQYLSNFISTCDTTFYNPRGNMDDAGQTVPSHAPPCPYPETDVFDKLLKKHQHEAANRLIRGDFTDLDPSIGDISCQMHALTVLDMYWTVQEYLDKEEKLQYALEIVEKYDVAHRNDKNDKEVRTLADLENPDHPREYDALFAELSEILGNDNLELLGLFYSLTVSNTVWRDEFGTAFYCVHRNLFGPGIGRDTRYPEFLDRLPILRSKLAKHCVDYFYNLVKTLLCSNTNRANAGSIPTVGEQLVEAVHKMTSYIEQRRPRMDDIPLVACHPQMRAVLLYEFKAGRPIIIVVRRIQIQPSIPSGSTYSLSDARALYYEADKDQGTYRFSRTITPYQEKVACLTFNCWNTFQTGTSGTGLNAADNTEYFDALSRCDVAWLINTYAAVHPPFSGKAKENSPDLYPMYEAICGEKGRTFDYSREGCAGFSLKEYAPNNQRPTLLEEWKMAEELASKYTFKDKVLITRTGNSKTAHSRIDYSVDFSVEHIMVSSGEKAKSFCGELMDRHQSVNAVIGPHITRIYEVGVGFTDKTLADKLCSSRKEDKKMLAYLAKHSNNRIFLTPLQLYLS